MNNILYYTILLLATIFYSCNTTSNRIEIKHIDNKYKLFINNHETYIKGIGGTYRLDIAKKMELMLLELGVGM